MKGKDRVWQRNVLYPMTLKLVILYKERIEERFIKKV